MWRGQPLGGSSPSASVLTLQRVTALRSLSGPEGFFVWVTKWVTKRPQPELTTVAVPTTPTFPRHSHGHRTRGLQSVPDGDKRQTLLAVDGRAGYAVGGWVEGTEDPIYGLGLGGTLFYHATPRASAYLGWDRIAFGMSDIAQGVIDAIGSGYRAGFRVSPSARAGARIRPVAEFGVTRREITYCYIGEKTVIDFGGGPEVGVEVGAGFETSIGRVAVPPLLFYRAHTPDVEFGPLGTLATPVRYFGLSVSSALIPSQFFE